MDFNDPIGNHHTVPSPPISSTVSFSFLQNSISQSQPEYQGSSLMHQDENIRFAIKPELQAAPSLFTDPQYSSLSHQSDQIAPLSDERMYFTATIEIPSTPSLSSSIIKPANGELLDPPKRSFFPSKTGVSFDDRLLAHVNHFSEHPENPFRILAIRRALEEQGLFNRVEVVLPRAAVDTEILLAHEPDYIYWLSSTSSKDAVEYEKESIYYNQYTAECARLAAGGAITLASKIVTGELSNGFAVIRPPGHHAECNKAYGFCFINNVAVAAKCLLQNHNIKRVMIVDWDVHHGNGTQNIFIDDPNVLYTSIHRYDDGEFFPCSRDADITAVGAGAGVGFNVNIPFSDDDMGDSEYLAAFTRVILPIAYEFNPEFILISAGFDAAEGDPIGEYHVSPNCYAHMTRMLMNLAGGKVLLLLEGGYSLDALAQCVSACVGALLMDPIPILNLKTPDLGALHTINNVISIQSKYWKILGSTFSSTFKLPIEQSEIEKPLPTSFKGSMLTSRIGLKDIFLQYWAGLLIDTFGMIRLPVPGSLLLDGDIFLSSNVMNTKNPIIIFLHVLPQLAFGPSLPSVTSYYYAHQTTNEDAYFIGELAYFERAFNESYSIIDIVIHHDQGHPILPQHVCEDGLVDENGHIILPSVNRIKIRSVILLSLGISKKIFLVGSFPMASASIAQLITQRQVEPILKGVILFPSLEGPGIPVAGQKTNWFFEHSKVFITSSEPFGTMIPFSKVYGACYSNGILDDLIDVRAIPIYGLSSAMALAIDTTFEFIAKRSLRHASS